MLSPSEVCSPGKGALVCTFAGRWGCEGIVGFSFMGFLGVKCHARVMHYYTPLPLNLADNNNNQANTSPSCFGRYSVPPPRIVP